jgi:hypothetical protein
MSDQTANPETEADELPPLPDAALDPIKLLGMTEEEIKAKTVDCASCPVFMLCESSTGGSGYVCKACKSTGVFLDEDKEDEILVLDCAKHKFPTKQGGEMEKCPLCCGTMMKFEYREMPPKNWVIFTVHSLVANTERRKSMNEALEHWKKHYAEEAEREAREKEKSAAAKKSK